MEMLTYETINIVRSLYKNYGRELRRLEDLNFCSTNLVPKLDGMPHSRAQTSKTETVATLIIEAEQKLADIGAQIEQAKFTLLRKIDEIPMRELPRRVLTYHYVSCQSFSAIARIMHFTKPYIFNLHEEGLKACGLDSREMMAFKTRNQLTKI